MASAPPAGAPAVEFRSLTKTYDGHPALRDLELTVDRGQLFGFLGPNGAGKTTAIRTLLDLIRPTAGQALALGFDSRGASVELRRRIGYLPPTPSSTAISPPRSSSATSTASAAAAWTPATAIGSSRISASTPAAASARSRGVTARRWASSRRS